MELKKEWKPTRAKYGSGEELWLGKRCVGCWFNPVVSRGDPVKYRAQTHLPSIKINEEYIDHSDREAAKRIVERITDLWFASLESSE